MAGMNWTDSTVEAGGVRPHQEPLDRGGMRIACS